MKTKIILKEQNTQQVPVSRDLEDELKKAFFIALKEGGYLNQRQFEECMRKL